jgi:hypothetical protein
MTPNTAEDRLRYAKQFASLFAASTNANVLLQLSPDKRIHAMKALSCLARFTGHQLAWQQIRQRYGLTWTTGKEKIDAFTRFFDDSKTLDKMLEWLRQARGQVPANYSAFFSFCTLTGLRASECVEAVKLIKSPADFKVYYNEDRQCLEHFRYANLFIRRTKAAYISFVNNEILQIAQNIDKTPHFKQPKEGK